MTGWGEFAWRSYLTIVTWQAGVNLLGEVILLSSHDRLGWICLEKLSYYRHMTCWGEFAWRSYLTFVTWPAGVSLLGEVILLSSHDRLGWVCLEKLSDFRHMTGWGKFAWRSCLTIVTWQAGVSFFEKLSEYRFSLNFNQYAQKETTFENSLKMYKH